MSENISVYHNNLLADAERVSATNVEALSSVGSLSDNRLSHKFITTTSGTTIEIDQPAGSIGSFRFLGLVDHNLNGGEAIVKTYPTASRTTPTAVISGAITSADPMIFDAGSAIAGTQFIDIELTSSGVGVTMSVGEAMLLTKFDSPQLPAVGINTDYLPGRTFINHPNRERQSIKHSEITRVKSYLIEGMSVSEVAQWIDLYKDNEGIELILLLDDEENTYAALMNQRLTQRDDASLFSLDLVFGEINL